MMSKIQMSHQHLIQFFTCFLFAFPSLVNAQQIFDKASRETLNDSLVELDTFYRASIEWPSQISMMGSRVFSDEKQGKAAIDILKSKTSLNLNDTEIQLLISRIHFSLDKYDELAIDYRNLQKSKRYNASQSLEIGFIAFVLGNYHDATEFAAEANRVLVEPLLPDLLIAMSLKSMPIPPANDDEWTNRVREKLRVELPVLYQNAFVAGRLLLDGKR